MYHHEQVLCRFKPSRWFYGRFSVLKKAVLGLFLRRSLVCRVGVSNDGRCSSIAIGPSTECKWVENKACAMPWCYGVGNFEVKTSRF